MVFMRRGKRYKFLSSIGTGSKFLSQLKDKNLPP